jgi:signal transduction histidine kinase
MNLLTNAVGALEGTSGGATMHTGVTTIDAERLAHSWLRAEVAPGDFVFVEVTDTGIGMSEATLAPAVAVGWSEGVAGSGESATSGPTGAR